MLKTNYFPIRTLNLIAASLMILAIAGCSDPYDEVPVEIVPVVGTLTYRGNPVADAQLTFRNDYSAEPAFAQTDARGKFRCVTNDSDAGIPAGEYIVTISSPHGGVPAKYADPESSPLHVTVNELGENELSLVLED